MLVMRWFYKDVIVENASLRDLSLLFKSAVGECVLEQNRKQVAWCKDKLSNNDDSVNPLFATVPFSDQFAAITSWMPTDVS